MFQELQNEIKIKFILHTKSPLSIRSQKGNVMDPSLPDMQCIRSRYQGEDTVIIPGSSLKGVIRSHYERIVSLFGGSCCNVVDRYEVCKEPKNIPSQNRGRYVYEKMCPACRLFGSTHIASRIRIVDAYPEKDTFTVMGERTGVGINRITGAAQRGALYDFEVVEEGKFQVEIFLKNYELYQFVLLLYVLKDLSEGYISLGAASTRGNGRVEIEKLEMVFREYRKDRIGLQDIEGIRAFKENHQRDVAFDWKNKLYGEFEMKDIDLNQILEELRDIEIEEKVKKVR